MRLIACLNYKFIELLQLTTDVSNSWYTKARPSLCSVFADPVDLLFTKKKNKNNFLARQCLHDLKLPYSTAGNGFCLCWILFLPAGIPFRQGMQMGLFTAIMWAFVWTLAPTSLTVEWYRLNLPPTVLCPVYTVLGWPLTPRLHGVSNIWKCFDLHFHL